MTRIFENYIPEVLAIGRHVCIYLCQLWGFKVQAHLVDLCASRLTSLALWLETWGKSNYCPRFIDTKSGLFNLHYLQKMQQNCRSTVHWYFSKTGLLSKVLWKSSDIHFMKERRVLLCNVYLTSRHLFFVYEQFLKRDGNWTRFPWHDMTLMPLRLFMDCLIDFLRERKKCWACRHGANVIITQDMLLSRETAAFILGVSKSTWDSWNLSRCI